ncbi:MAG: hypothetical protein GC205_02285 [Bacteroidetes bacterium]|nr:hypothetical protein [Bacteroidota bacterium]
MNFNRILGASKRPSSHTLHAVQASTFGIIFAALVTFSACKEDHHHHDEPYDVTISFLEPSADATLTSGDEVHMEVLFTSPGTIHNVKVRVIRESDQADVFFWEEHVHEESGSYEFHEHLTLTSTDHEAFTIEASTWDHDSELEPIVLTRAFHLHP